MTLFIYLVYLARIFRKDKDIIKVGSIVVVKGVI